MLIQDTSISVRFNKIENLKKIYFLNEELLKTHFNEATVLPVPDEAPLEIPRIILKSKNEHSQLNITPVNATLQIIYNDGYEKNWDNCATYIMGKMDIIFKFLNIVTNDEYEYIGMVTNVIIDEIAENGAQFLANNLLKNDISSRIYDISLKYTFREFDDMFVNVELQNARMYRQGVNLEVAGGLNTMYQDRETVGVTIDINDRFGFNMDKHYKTNKEKVRKILEISTIVINEKLDSLIYKGEY
ncbi:MAG: hypothetical protein RSE41_10255 [Clostridia bacterium]